ncbi:hypothetical protein MNBD_NITROSPINAE03-1360, partial [hydrothermal vent metagenome]
MSNSRRHHFVPKMLLKRFTDDDGYLYVFDKDQPKNNIERRSPKGVFWGPYFYTSRTVDGTKDTTLEDDFSKLESDTDPIIKKIVRQARKGESPNLTEEEKKTWDRFFYTQWKRT